MAMNSLILSRDATAISLLRRVLGESGISIETCTGSAQFKELVSARKFDAVFVDCDDVDGAPATFKEMRGLPSNRKTIGFAIVNGITTLQQAFEMGANFVLDKPLAAERISRSLRAAQGLMANERRRYYRHPVATTVHLSLGTDTQEQTAITVNLSEGGFAMKSDKKTEIGMPVRFRFLLPETHIWIDGKGEIAWVSANGLNGVKFGVLSDKARNDLQAWLAKKMSGPDMLPPIFINATSKRYY
jgi:DNA-binding response OmpR family regulator